MRSYCIYCNRETILEVVRIVLYNRRQEKKIKGYCKSCGESMCRIVTTKIAKSK
jgi:ribosomal protein L44E